MASAFSRARLSEPELASLKSAARAAIVMPAVFAFADKVIADTQTATFAAFGSFAMLVLVEFTGRPRSRLTAYLTPSLVGAGLRARHDPRRPGRRRLQVALKVGQGGSTIVCWRPYEKAARTSAARAHV